MILAHLNYIAVFVCTIIYFFIGSMWFSMLFGKPWMEGHGISMPTDEEKKAAMKKEMPKYMLMSFLFSLIAVLSIDYIETAMFAHNWMTGVKAGILAGAFVVVAMGQSHMYLKKTFKLFLIDAGYHVVSLIIIGVVLAVWH
jgi:hypothetical protein